MTPTHKPEDGDRAPISNGGAGMDPHAHWIPSADGLARRNPAPDASPAMVPNSRTVMLKIGNEFAPFHRSASHVEPAYRDGWNQCYAGATGLLAEKAQRIERLEAALRCLLEEVRMQLTYSSSPGLDAARAALSQPHPHGG